MCGGLIPDLPSHLDSEQIAQQKRIEQLEAEVAEQARLNGIGSEREARLEAELKNKDAVRLWNECENLKREMQQVKHIENLTRTENQKLRAANEVLRGGLEFQSRYCECGTITEHYSNGEHRGFDLHEEIEKALESADKIMNETKQGE